MEKENKSYTMKVEGVEHLNEETLGMLIDGLVDLYTRKFGLNMQIDEPDKPEYDAENLDVAKTYLKKFRLQ